MHLVALAVFVFLAFLLGAVPFAYLFVKKLKGIDIRKVGSGNVGATNAARVLGKPLGLTILALDVLKGAAAAWLVPMVFGLVCGGASEAVQSVISAQGTRLCMGLAAFLGHCFSPFLRFRGGKGVATALGVFLVLAWKATLVTFAVCAVIILTTRLVSLASLTGAVLLPVCIVVFHWRERPWVLLGVTLVLSAMIVLRHRDNVRRLLGGTEAKV